MSGNAGLSLESGKERPAAVQAAPGAAAEDADSAEGDEGMGDSSDAIADQLAATRADADEKIRALSRRVERTTGEVLPQAAGAALIAAGLAMVGAGVFLGVRALRRPSLRDGVTARLAGARATAGALRRAAREGLPPVQITVGRLEGDGDRGAIVRDVALRLAQAVGMAAGTAAVSRLASRPAAGDGSGSD
jgi:hypothetical protein